MKIKNLRHTFERNLTFFAPSTTFEVFTPKLILSKRAEAIVTCQLTFCVDWETYQKIDSGALFNLQPEIRGNIHGKPFESGREVELSLNLRPDLLPQLAVYGQNVAGIADLFTRASNDPSTQSLVTANHWFALQIEQKQDQEKSYYHTLWYHLKISKDTPKMLEKGNFLPAIVKFIQERPDLDPETIGESLASELTPSFLTEIFAAVSENMQEELGIPFPRDILHLLDEEFSQTTSPKYNEPLSHELKDLLAEKLETLFTLDSTEETNPNENVSDRPDSTKSRLFETTLGFFADEGWTIYALKGETTFGTIYKGQEREFICYARIYVDAEQLIFYSIFPEVVPESRRSPVSEFLTRLNFGLLIGNFEMNFLNGQIRYKTSIDVEGDRLTAELIGQLVRANLNTMEGAHQHISIVINGELSPEEAIASLQTQTIKPPIYPTTQPVDPC
ncbi:hypothetical protein APA_1177 [Pseudanabaena sp. lw0831]|uniref:YbjN domain-containing protein n=1 Tax=Pseudanabaena sp. lw0831 TaxID=1357935 RepID=UPI001915B23E|nr:YbjN domain-containing protein [Pseudanabaena sp. lw0831]GBO53270.1 hypothetical protein APA_1177 [Pseudanabaena sp. lw0831]